VGTAFFHFVTNYASGRRTNGQTDGQTAFSWLDRVACNARSAVKKEINEVRQQNLRPSGLYIGDGRGLNYYNFVT